MPSISSLLRGLLVITAIVFHVSGAARASTLEPAGLNLGDTSFNDGFGSVDPVWVYQQYFQIDHFAGINDEYGNRLTMFQDTSITAIASVNQLIYVSPLKLFGGALGFDTLLPVVSLSSHVADTSPATLKSNNFGFGDLTFGPFLQLPPIMSDGHPVFTQRFEFDVIAPSGRYNVHDDINQSAGFYSLNPYWAFTVLPLPKVEISSRLYYLYNFRNNHPASSGPPSELMGTYQAGQAISDNFAASYTALPGLDVGVNGYIFRQITQDKVNGAPQTGSETTNLSIGPGVNYNLDEKNFLFANAYLPVVEQNTLDGFNLVLRWTHIF